MTVTRVVVATTDEASGEVTILASEYVPRTFRTPVTVPEEVYWIGDFDGTPEEAKQRALDEARARAQVY